MSVVLASVCDSPGFVLGVLTGKLGIKLRLKSTLIYHDFWVKTCNARVHSVHSRHKNHVQQNAIAKSLKYILNL